MYRNFCIVLALFAVSVSTLPVDGPDSLPPYVATCKKACNASDALIKTLVDYLMDPLVLEIDDSIAHCVLGCWLDELELVKSDGTINTAPLLGDSPEDIENLDEVTDGFQKCADQPGEGYEKKYMIYVCLIREAKRIKFWWDMH